MASPTPESSFSIRQATLEDLDGVFEVYAAVAAERVHIGGEPPIDREARLAKWREHFHQPHHVTFVAVDDERIVGSASITWAGVSEIGMALLPEWRGRGIGSALLEGLIEWAEADGSHKLELYVWPHNAAALALYEKFGFEQEGYLKKHYRRANGELWDCIVMGLQLPRHA